MIKILFEPHNDVNINNSKVFRHYIDNYLADYNIEYAGFIMMDCSKKILKKMEPVWQYVINEPLDPIKEYIEANPPEGYYAHIYDSNELVCTLKNNF